eukprot:jgi/Tetstr1/447321/TSEL_034758.t1
MDISGKTVRAWETIRQMLSDRGVSYDSASGIGDEEVRELTREFTTFGVSLNETTAVVFHTSSSTIKKTDLFSAADGASHVIVVFHSKPQGTTTRSITSEGGTRGVTFEFFELKHLQYNVSRHMDVPKHEKVPKADVDAILKTYYVKSKFHLPLILETDPMSRYLGLKHGDLVKITRGSHNCGNTVFYRCCKA